MFWIITTVALFLVNIKQLCIMVNLSREYIRHVQTVKDLLKKINSLDREISKKDSNINRLDAELWALANDK